MLGLGSYPTAWRWLHKLRRAMVRPGRDRLPGTVEVDEVYVGGERSGPRGRGATGKALVLVSAQTDGAKIGRIRLARIANASGPQLVGAVGRSVEPGSQVLTDGWDGYAGLEAQGYRRKIVRATAIVGGNLLPRAHRVASLLKRWLLGTHQGAVAHSHLDYYLDEFTFRFNRRTSRSRGLLFYRLLEQAVALGPVLCEDLIGGSHKGLRSRETHTWPNWIILLASGAWTARTATISTALETKQPSARGACGFLPRACSRPASSPDGLRTGYDRRAGSRPQTSASPPVA